MAHMIAYTDNNGYSEFKVFDTEDGALEWLGEQVGVDKAHMFVGDEVPIARRWLSSEALEAREKRYFIIYRKSQGGSTQRSATLLADVGACVRIYCHTKKSVRLLYKASITYMMDMQTGEEVNITDVIGGLPTT